MSLLLLLAADAASDPRDLATLAGLRRLLQTPDDQTAQDPLFREMITEASVMLCKELGRQFRAQPGVAKTIAYHGGGYLNLAPYEIRSATAIVKDSDGPGSQAISSTAWRLRGATGDDTYRLITLTDYATERLTGFREQAVTITGDWGFPEIPPDIERGVKITVKTWLREGATFTPDGDVIRFERIGRIPQDVLDGLSHYRMPVVG